VEDRRAKEPVQRLQNLAIALRAFLVQVRVIAQVDARELFERDVRLPPDAVAPVEDSRSLACFDLRKPTPQNSWNHNREEDQNQW
jgi:hypothetical protein